MTIRPFCEDFMRIHHALVFVFPSLLLACGAGAAKPANAPSGASAPAASVATATPASATVAATAPASAGAQLASEPAVPEGFVVFSASDLRASGKRLSTKLNEKKSASEPLGKYGTHSALIGRREGSGEAELHETLADFFVVEEGEARLVVGGTIEHPATQSPGEIRGSAITGGVTRPLKSGDIVHIPAKVPHQLLLDPGAQFTYFIIKVEAPKP